MAEYTEADMKEFEGVESNDSLILLKEVKALRAEVNELKGTIIKKKSDAQKKAEIMRIKDTNKRLQAIRENMDLFK